MDKVYLMQRFEMNEGFPNKSPQGIESYILESFVLIHENGNMIPLKEGLGETRGISPKIAQRLKKIQDKGYEINGGVHPLYSSPINIQGDMEFYRQFPPNAEEHNLLTEQGVRITYD